MNEAAVGFQCPSCVAEGARSTRQRRTAYGGRPTGNPALTSIALIVSNVAVWLGVLATGGAASRLIERLALLPLGRCDAGNQMVYNQVFSEQVCQSTPRGTWVTGVVDGAWWQLLTNAFTHVEVWHIGFNMLALWFLGPQLEAALGRVRFLALYVLSALAGSTAVMWLDAPYSATLGASGAVFGLIGGLLVIAHKVGGDVSQILIWLALNAFLTFTIPNISWQGHLGGFLGGVLVAAVLAYAPRARRTTWQVAGLAATAALLLGLLAVRIVSLG